jgi:hypothetical protein
MSALLVFLKAVESGAKTTMSSCGGSASAGMEESTSTMGWSARDVFRLFDPFFVLYERDRFLFFTAPPVFFGGLGRSGTSAGGSDES